MQHVSPDRRRNRGDDGRLAHLERAKEHDTSQSSVIRFARPIA
jgi:hypothetical protein